MVLRKGTQEHDSGGKSKESLLRNKKDTKIQAGKQSTKGRDEAKSKSTRARSKTNF